MAASKTNQVRDHLNQTTGDITYKDLAVAVGSGPQSGQAIGQCVAKLGREGYPECHRVIKTPRKRKKGK